VGLWAAFVAGNDAPLIGERATRRRITTHGRYKHGGERYPFRASASRIESNGGNLDALAATRLAMRALPIDSRLEVSVAEMSADPFPRRPPATYIHLQADRSDSRLLRWR